MATKLRVESSAGERLAVAPVAAPRFSLTVQILQRFAVESRVKTH